MQVFDFDDFLAFLKARLKVSPNQGRGEVSRIARSLKTNSTTVSLILHGKRTISVEQALKLANYLGLTNLEKEYFMCLVQKDRAGTSELRDFYHQQIIQIKEKALRLTNRVANEKVLSPEDKARFYSSWHFTAIRNLIAIPGCESPEEIAKYLGLKMTVVAEILEFLIGCGLCIRTSQSYAVGPKATHLDDSSPFIRQHHTNWRLKNLDRVGALTGSELMYTGPMSLSQKDATILKSRILKLIEEAVSIVRDSPSEELRCLTIDWVKV